MRQRLQNFSNFRYRPDRLTGVWVLLLLALVLTSNINSQSTANYAYTTSTTGSLVLDKDGNAVDMSTGTTQLYGAGVDTYTATLQNLGFTYIFMGVPYTQFSANPDGQVQLGSTLITGHTQTAALSTAKILALNTDNITGSGTGKVHFKVQSGTGGQVLVIEWKDILINWNATGTTLSTYQLRLYEASGAIEMVYGQMWNSSTSAQSSSIGFSSSNTAGTIGQLTTINVTPTYNSSSTSYTTTSFALSSAMTNLNSAADGSRTVFTFTPPATAPAAPTNLTFSNVGIGGMRLNWTDNSSDETSFGILMSTDGVTYSAYGSAAANATSFTASGLSLGTLYYWRVVALNEGRTSTAASGSQSTNASPTMSGTKYVGTGANPQDYATLTEALNDLVSQGLAGAVVLELQSGYTSGGETFPLSITNITGLSATNTLKIYPSTGVTGLTISGSSATALIDLNNADYVTIDGRPGGTGSAKEVTVSNTGQGPAIRLINDATNNTIKYLTVASVCTSASTGVVFFSTAASGTTGNDDNRIEYCDIKDGATTPTNGIYSAGTTTTSTLNNSGNIIANNSIYNFFLATGQSSGVLVSTGNTDWTIQDNHFYQTSSRTHSSTSGLYRVISIETTAGNNFTVTGNFIGGSSSSAGGTAWTQTGSGNNFLGIRMSCGTTTASSVQGNTIRNISITTSTTSTVSAAISVTSGSVNIGTTTGNIIGDSTTTSSITWTGSGTGANFKGINFESSGVANIQNNKIGSITVTGTGTTLYRGIQVSSGSANNYQTVSNNVVGGSVANSISNSTNNDTYGIHTSSTTPNFTISGNRVRNITATNTLTAGELWGIYSQGALSEITNNLITDLATSTTSTTVQLIGISVSNTSSNGNTISRNTVHSLTQANSGSGTTHHAYGIYVNVGTTTATTISRNLIHSLRLSTTGSAITTQIRGIDALAGAVNIINNMIRVGIYSDGSSVTGGYFIQGISIQTGGTSNTYFNSVYVGGSSVTGGQPTHGIRKSNSSGTHDIRNNILFNARSNSTGTGKHYAVLLNGVTGVTSNYNLLYTTGTGGVFGSADNGTTDRASLSAWQAATGFDGNSGSGDPNYIAPTGTSSTVDLHIQSPTPIEGQGVDIASVTEDFDGQTRSGLTPVDIGADAGNFIVTDIFPPSLTYTTPATKTASTSNRSFVVTITDATGVPISESLVPRIWFKRSAPSATSWVSLEGTLESGDGNNGVWRFTLDYSLLALTPVLGETYQFYFVAQDEVGTPNIATTPGGGSHTDVNTQVSAPSSPHTYTIVQGFAGTYNVGPSELTYTSLTGAAGSPGGFFAAVNAGTLTGNVTLNITGDITEAGTNGLSQWTEEGTGNYTLTILPSDATVKTLSGTVANAMIRLDGCDRVTIDGRFGGSGKYLLFRNTNTSNPTINIQSDATGNTIRNCIIEGANTTATQGVVFITPGTTFVTGNDNNTITENQIRDRSDGTGVPANLIYSAGYSTTVRNSGNTISSNELFNFTGTGVFFASTNQANENTTVTGNTIYQGAARSTEIYGMRLNTLGTSNTVSENTIRDLNTSSGAYGIYIDDVGTVKITRNRIYNFPSTSGSTGTLMGIYNFGGTNSVSYIVNNQISIIPSFTNAQTIYGIRDYANSGDSNYVYYNSVYIGGTGSGTTKTYAWDDNTTATKDVMKNNLFVNARTGGTGGHFAARHAGNTSITDMNSDNNVYVGNGPTSGSNFELGSTAATFTAYKAAFTGSGKDVNSYSINAADLTVANLYSDVTTGNLNIVTTNAEGWLVAGKAAQLAVAGLTDVDYNGNVRSTTAAGGKTSIGSHEFSRAGLPTPPDATVSGAPDTGTPTTITVNGRTIATITWYGSGLPSGITVRYYSGRTHPNATTGFNSNGYWVITQTGGTSFTYDITLYYEEADLGDITESRIKVAKYDSGNWLTYAGTLNTTNNTILIPGLSSFSDFTLTDSDNPLPVELVNFNAKAKNRNALLSWETKTEVDNSGFEVERLDKEGDWKKVTFIEGHGTSNSTKYYSFEDTKLSAGKHSYRLKQIDNDGTTSYSDVVEVTIDVPKEFALSQNYPNPFNPSTKVDYQLAADSRVTIELFSITGERVAVLVNQEQEAGYYTMMIDSYTNRMASGIYIYRMIATDAAGKNFVATKKLSLLK